MLHSNPRKNAHGFSLIEMMIVVAIVLILAAFSVPTLLKTVSDISLRYSATDLSGLLQSARIQAVRKNTFYSVVQATLPSGTNAYILDLNKTGIYANSEPNMPINPGLTIHQGTGSGAPNEAAFLAGLNFTVDPTGAAPSFNARGLPCMANLAANTCPMVPSQGFVVFMSKPVIMGNSPWAAVVINPSGHMQVWNADANGNWVQRD